MITELKIAVDSKNYTPFIMGFLASEISLVMGLQLLTPSRCFVNGSQR